MRHLAHQSAKPSHYNKEAPHYDSFNEKDSEVTNGVIEKNLKKYKVKTVLDLTCGTGSQVFWLQKQGYEVVGADINTMMLNIAREKALNDKLDLKFIKGDMRTIKVGMFDAVITIFNAVGHLTKLDFEKAMRNIHENLNDGGLYVFDIFNLSYLLENDNITKLTIDGQKKTGDTLRREIQYSTIDNEGVLASFDIYIDQKGADKPKITKAFQTLQVYSVEQLDKMLQNNGFKIIHQCGIDGSRFIESKTERMMIVAKKR